MSIKFKQKNYFKNILNSCIFFSYLDILSLDNDSFDYRKVDQLNKLDHKKIIVFYLFILINQNKK
jgi:hypothetical protein